MLEALRVPAPGADWFKDVLENTKYTPDVAELETAEYMNFLVYDNTLPDLESNSYPLQTAFTVEEMEMWTYLLGNESYPIPLNMPDTMLEGTRLINRPWQGSKKIIRSKIKGKIYSVKTSHVFSLDTVKVNTVQFNRIRVPVVIPYTEIIRTKWGDRVGPEHHRLVTVSMYVGVRSFWDPLLDDGFLFKPTKRYKYFGASSIKDYAEFVREEEIKR